MTSLIDPAEQTGKTRAQRIRLDYFHRRRWLDTWRWIAIALCGFITAIYLAWVSVTPGGTAHISTGKISAAHASFESSCSQCHVDFVPIASDAWRLQPANSIEKTAAKCRQCHTGVGHHSNILNVSGKLIDQQCSGCHDEHRGRNHQLIPATDNTCVGCHQDASGYCELPQSGDEFAIRNVTRFSHDEHGDFRSLFAAQPEPSASIEFDHALHMQPGQTAPGQRGGMQLDRMPIEHRQRYQRPGQLDEALVQLQCADCHRFQSESAGRVRSGDFDWGRNSLPIRYDQHCIACHPLTLPGQRESQVAIVHGVAPQALQDSIRGQFATVDEKARRTTFLPQDDWPPIRIPGTRPAAPNGTSDAMGDNARGRASVQESSQRRLEWITGRLRQQCQLCHSDRDLDVTVSLPRMPQPRLRAGRFDHGAHRGVACIACHPNADPAQQTVSPQTKPVLTRWLQHIGAEPFTLSGSAPHGDGTQAAELNAGEFGSVNDADLILGIRSCTPCHHDSATRTLAGERDAESQTSYTELFGGLSDQASGRCLTCHQYHTYGEQTAPNLSPASNEREITVRHPLATPGRGRTLLNGSADLDAFLAFANPFHRSSAIGLVNMTMPQAAGTPAASAAPSSTNTPSPDSPQQPRDAASLSRSGHWIGSDSCATSTCHGGPIRETPDWNSSQTVFEAHDPHARAGLVLADPSSRRIVIALDPNAGSSPQHFQQVLRTRCSGCHAPSSAEGVSTQPAMQRGAVRSASANSDSRSSLPDGAIEGVSCEACHGPASGWVESHLRDDWTVGDAMRENRDYIARLDGCVRCHVGSRRADGMIRDVNHDLIAAGHPALRFDPWSALRRLPRHGDWGRSDDGLPSLAGEAELRRFLVGRVVALRAAIKLTAQRLEDATRGSHDSVWPELADYDCFACHQHLKITDVATRPRAGYPTPHPWLRSGLVEDGLRQVAADDATRLTKAMEILRLRTAGGRQIVPAAREIESILDRYLARLSDPRQLPPEVVSWHPLDKTRLRQSSQAADAIMPADADWYDAAYWYLRSHVLVRQGRRASDKPAVGRLLEDLGDALQFDRPGRRNQFAVDSPEFFEIERFRKLAEELTELMDSRR